MNRVFIIGRLTREPMLYSTSTGVGYVRGTIAVDRRLASKDTKTDFIPFVAWRSNAEIFTKYTTKGSLIAIEGSFTSSRFESKDRGIIQTYEVTVDFIELLESRETRERRMSNSGEFNASNFSSNFSNVNKSFQNSKFNSNLNDNEKFGPSNNQFSNSDYSEDQGPSQNFDLDLEDEE